MIDRSEPLAPLARLARARRRCTAVTAIAAIAAATGLTLIVLAAIDTRTMSAPPVRMVLAGLLLAAVVVAIFHGLRKTRRHDLAEAARTLEAARPDQGQLFRTALEFADQRAAADPTRARYIDRIVSESGTSLSFDGSWKSLIPKKRRTLALVAATAALVMLTAQAIRSTEFRLALGRTLAPTSATTYSRLTWTGLPESFDDRHPPRVEFRVDGRAAQPELLVRSTGGTWEKANLTPRSDGRTWDVVFTGRAADLEVRLAAGDAKTVTAIIPYRPIPKLIASRLTLRYPDYTGIQNESLDSADARAVEATEAAWEFTFNAPPARIEWSAGTATPRDLSLEADKPLATVTETLQVGKSTATLSIYDSGGALIDSWRYELEGTVDKLPVVELLEPTKDREATPVTELPVRIRARDDYGIAEIGLILDAAGKRQWVLEKVIKTRDQRQITEFVRAMLETVPLDLTDNVRLYAYALDHKTRGGPRAVSPLVSIDIREFKRRYRFQPNAPRPPPQPGGEPGEPAPDPLQVAQELMRLEQMIKQQRGILSAVFALKESHRGALPPVAAEEAKQHGIAEKSLSEGAGLLLDSWITGGEIPADDITLLDTAATQLGEAAGFLAVPQVALGFTSADQALGTLLDLRKELLRIIMHGNSPSGEPMDSPPENLTKLAAEARRLAKEEHEVRDQISPENLPGTNLEATRRQQEVAIADAGELYAALVDHPERSEGAVGLMDEAEKAMLEADTGLRKPDVSSASPPLELAETRLLELATYLDSLNEQQLSDTLRELAEKAEKAEQDAREDAGEMPAPQADEEIAQNEQAGEQANRTGKNARETRMADDILRELAEREAGRQPEGEGEAESKLEALRQRAGAGPAAEDLEKLAEQQAVGEDAKELAGGAAEKLGTMAEELREEGRRLDASRLAELSDAAESARKAREALEEEQRRQQASGDPFATNPQKPAPLPPAGGGDEEGPGTSPGAPKQRWSNEIGELAEQLERLHDERLNQIAPSLEYTPFHPLMIPRIQQVEQRLQELIGEIPNPSALAAGRSSVPEKDRREIEDYYRDLSDDFGGEVWEK